MNSELEFKSLVVNFKIAASSKRDAERTRNEEIRAMGKALLPHVAAQLGIEVGDPALSAVLGELFAASKGA